MTEKSNASVEQNKKRESSRRDAVEAWHDYQQNGRHVTSKEADIWLEKLANGEVAELPEDHI